MHYVENIGIDTIVDRMLLDEKNSDDDIKNVLDIVLSVNIDDTTYITERRVKVDDYKKQLATLMGLPRVEQRTDEWFKMRKGMITASDFAQALGDGKFGTQRQFYAKKSGYEEDKFNPNMPPLKWGVMFEPVAAEIYEQRRHVKLHDFGLLQHPTVPYFGASPDGITEQGVMVEIKCPFKRKITGDVPLQYYYQIQGQLDVCGLDECDFLECEFTEYTSEDDYLSDASYFYERGIIIEVMNGQNEASSYVYSPIMRAGFESDEQKSEATRSLIAWRDKNVTQNTRCHYWKLTLCSIVRVYKDDEFVKEKLAELGLVWEKINAYRSDRGLYNKEIGGALGSNTTSTRAPSSRVPAQAPLTGYAFLDD